MGRSSRRMQAALASAVGVIALAACGGSSSTGSSSGSAAPAQGAPIKIGSIMSVTGPLAVFGIQEKQAIQLAIDQANNAGGVNGHMLQLTSYDPAGDTAQGVALTRRLLDQDQVKLVIGGGASSGVALAMQKILTPRNIFFATGEADPSLTNPVAANPTTFQTTVTSDTVMQALMTYATAHGVKSIAVLADTGAFGQGGITAAKNLAGPNNVKVTSASYEATATDLTPQLQQLASTSPDAYIIWTASPSGVIAIKNAAALGLKGLIMTAHSYANPKFMTQAGDASKILTVPVADATVYSQVASLLPSGQKTTLLNFADAYQKAYNQPINIYAAEAYDAAEVALRALSLTGGDPSGLKMAQALEQAGSYAGVMGTFHLSTADHYGLSSTDVRIAKWSGTDWALQTS